MDIQQQDRPQIDLEEARDALVWKLRQEVSDDWICPAGKPEKFELCALMSSSSFKSFHQLAIAVFGRSHPNSSSKLLATIPLLRLAVVGGFSEFSREDSLKMLESEDRSSLKFDKAGRGCWMLCEKFEEIFQRTFEKNLSKGGQFWLDSLREARQFEPVEKLVVEKAVVVG